MATRSQMATAIDEYEEFDMGLTGFTTAQLDREMNGISRGHFPTSQQVAKVQEKIRQNDPFVINTFKPARLIDNRLTKEFKYDDAWCNIWNATISATECDGQIFEFLVVFIVNTSRGPCLVTSLFAPVFIEYDFFYHRPLIVHERNDKEIREVTGKSFDELVNMLEIPGNKQIAETMWSFVPSAFLLPPADKKKMDHRILAKNNLFRLFPHGNTVGPSIKQSMEGTPDAFFIEQDGSVVHLMDFHTNKASKKTREGSARQTWQPKVCISYEWFRRNATDSTSSSNNSLIPRMFKLVRKSDWCGCFLFDLSYRCNTNDGTWYTIDDHEAFKETAKRTHKSYEGMTHNL